MSSFGKFLAVAAVATLIAAVAGLLGCGSRDLSSAGAMAEAVVSSLDVAKSDSVARIVADSIEVVRRILRSGTKSIGRADSVLERQVAAVRADAVRRNAELSSAAAYADRLRQRLDSIPLVDDRRTAAIASIVGAVVWPTILLAIVGLILWKPNRLGQVLKPFQSIRVFNSEVVLNSEVTTAAVGTIRQLRDQATQRFRQIASKQGLQQRFFELMQHRILPELEEEQKRLKAESKPTGDLSSVRATLYIPDILFEKHLSQIADYWPSGAGLGRSFPVYFGIIGKAWRLGSSVINGKVPTDHKTLILEWGMTLEEAVAKGKDRQSFAAIVLKEQNMVVGIFYIDCKPQDAFGSTFESFVTTQATSVGLQALLAKVAEEAREYATPIPV